MNQQINHIRKQNHQVKVPGNHQLDVFAYKTFCEKHLPYASTRPIKGEVNCPICVQGLVQQKREEADRIERDYL